MNTETIAATAHAIYERVQKSGSTWGALHHIDPIGPFHATSANRGNGTSRFLFRYDENKEHRLWCIEYDVRTKNILAMRGPIDDLDNHEQMLSELSKFRIFHG